MSVLPAGTALAVLAALVALAAFAAGPARAAPEPEPHGTRDLGGFRNILPPGQNGHADAGQVIAFTGLDTFFGSGDPARPPHSSDQLAPYEDLVFESPTLPADRLPDFFKDATFGVRSGDVAKRYSPRADVTIQRDRGFGVPHIYGETRTGAMFGAGYVGAEDRLFVMDALRHVGRAQLSSFIGGSEGNREMDREQWRIAPYTEADLQQQFERGDELYGEQGRVVQRDVQAYVAGINKYICEAQPQSGCSAAQLEQVDGNNGATPAEKLPGAYGAITPNGLPGPQPRLWKVTDVIATASLVGGIFGKGGGREVDSALVLQEALDKFGPDGRDVWADFRSAEDPEAPTTSASAFPYQVPPDDPADDSQAMPDAATLESHDVVAAQSGPAGVPGGLFGSLSSLAGGSNALLVSGAQSRSGRPLAVFGPQTAYFSPQLLMELDIHAPASDDGPAIDARGAAFAGVNLYVQLGRGQGYAWSATSAGQDNTDTFALDLCEPEGGPPSLESSGYVYRGECHEFEEIERQNQWLPNAADQSEPGTETLLARRTKLGLEVARGEVDGDPMVYVQLRSTYMHEADSAGGFVDFNDPAAMQNAEQFKRAASKIGFTFNWFYVDDRDIAYFNSGNNPQRPEGPDPNFPVRACPGDSSAGCKYEWSSWDPDLFTADYTPFGEHPQATNPPYLTSWNNKQAPEYRAADDNYSFQSVHRSEPLDDRIQAATAGDSKLTLPGLVDAMEDAGTVDLRGDKVLPFALEVLGSESDPALLDAIEKLREWQQAGAHRRDEDGDGNYEHAEAVKIMDAWWPRWIEAQFKGPLGDDLYERVRGMVGLHDAPGELGSAFISGWYGYAEKDLRAILGHSPDGEYSRRYCGDGDIATCRELLRDALADALAEPESALYPEGTCEDKDGSERSAQWCHDAVRHTAVGAITQPPIHWINRPTFQQVVEVQRSEASQESAPSTSEERGADPGRRRPAAPSAERHPPGTVGVVQRPTESGRLPFTGFFLVALLAAAVLLVGGGWALHKRVRKR